MNKLFTFATLALLFTAPVALAADNEPAMESSPAAQQAMQTSQTVQSELQNGDKVEVDPDNSVWVFNQYGAKSAAPDGALTMKDGTTVNVKDGKKV